jgi:hypothetical protein
LVAVLLALGLNLQLRRSGDLGFYDSDYNQMQDAHRPLLRALLTDEPLFNLYHALRYRVLGTEPRAHHLLQGTLGVVAALLSFGLVWRLSGDRLLSFVFLLLFLTYPDRGEAFYWPGALYVPMLVCLLVAAHCALRGLYWGCWAAYTAAVFTHEAAFGFLAVMAVLLWPRWRQLLPLALSNAAYLLVRQTRWFGLGDPGYLYMRQLEPGRVGDNLAASLRVHFGSFFWNDTEGLIREGSAGGSLLPVLVVLAGVLLVVAGRDRLLGMAAALTTVAGLGCWMAARPLPDLVEVLKLALVVAVVAAVGAMLVDPLPYGRGSVLALLGVLWFFAAYAPTYLLYVAPRHSYLPSVGVCLVLAVALRLPARRLVLEGVALGLTALIATGFYAAGRGEVERWARAAGVIREFRRQMLATKPSLPRDTRVVVLGLPSVPGVPILPSYALQAALREWYGHDQILAASEFTARPEGFELVGVAARQSYERLLLFTWDHGKLVERGGLVFPDGAEVRLPGSAGPPLAIAQ